MGRRTSTILHNDRLRGGHYCSLRQCRVNSLRQRRGGSSRWEWADKPLSLVKKAHQNLGAHCSQLHRGLSTCLQSHFQDPIPPQCPHFHRKHPRRLGLHLTLQFSQSQKERLGLIFSSLSLLARGDKPVLQNTRRCFWVIFEVL